LTVYHLFAGNFQPGDCFGNCAGIGGRTEPEVEFQQFSHLLQSEWRHCVLNLNELFQIDIRLFCELLDRKAFLTTGKFYQTAIPSRTVAETSSLSDLR
jgi:hypothetical protein